MGECGGEWSLVNFAFFFFNYPRQLRSLTCSSWSSSCRVDSTEFPEFLSPSTPIILVGLPSCIQYPHKVFPARPTLARPYIIIIMTCRQHWYPWISLATSPYHSSPLAGLQGYIPYPHIAAGCMFELVVLLLPGHMWGSIGVHHLWAPPCFSSTDLHVCFVHKITLLISWWVIDCMEI